MKQVICQNGKEFSLYNKSAIVLHQVDVNKNPSVFYNYYPEI